MQSQHQYPSPGEMAEFQEDAPTAQSPQFQLGRIYSGSQESLTERPLPPRLMRYVGSKVTLYYNSSTGYSDSGSVTYLDENWIELTKDNGEQLLVPVVAVRLLKLIEAPQTGDAGILLRPAEGAPEPRRIGRE